MEGHKVETIEELELMLSTGVPVMCCWTGQEPMHVTPGTVESVKEGRVLVNHWCKHWYPFSGSWYEFRAFVHATR